MCFICNQNKLLYYQSSHSCSDTVRITNLIVFFNSLLKELRYLPKPSLSSEFLLKPKGLLCQYFFHSQRTLSCFYIWDSCYAFQLCFYIQGTTILFHTEALHVPLSNLVVCLQSTFQARKATKSYLLFVLHQAFCQNQIVIRKFISHPHIFPEDSYKSHASLSQFCPPIPVLLLRVFKFSFVSDLFPFQTATHCLVILSINSSNVKPTWNHQLFHHQTLGLFTA